MIVLKNIFLQKISFILNGTNIEDIQDYRPGLQAAQEHAVKSPLVDCSVDKSLVRALAKSFNLKVWNKPASPCLSSRLPYGERVEEKKLNQIEAGENFLQQLGFSVNRIRYFNNKAKIEVPQNQIEKLKKKWQKIEEKLLSLGFEQVIIDLQGFSSGKLNRLIE